jgi:hypothetical protein
MASNAVRFQKRHRVPQCLAEYGTEEQSAEALYRWRWPDGFVCPQCHYTGLCTLHSRALFQCHRCHHQTSLMAGTLCEYTILPFTT